MSLAGTKTVTKVSSVPEEIARAAFGRWQYNGHDVYDALTHVNATHVNPRVKALAGEAADLVLTTPMLRGAYDVDFAARLAAERHAAG